MSPTSCELSMAVGCASLPTNPPHLMLRRLLLALLVSVTEVAIAQSPAPTSSTPSFDCAKARGRVEKLICAEPQLGALDRRLQEIYAIALAQATDPSDVKRAQRRWLADRDDCKDSGCLTERYAMRLNGLGSLTGKFPAQFVAALCARIIDPQTRSETLANIENADGINNDGTADRASECAGGAANVPCVEYANKDGTPLLIQRDGVEWLTYSAPGRAAFRFEGHTFTYYAHDERLELPAYLSYITPTNRDVRVCDFDTVIGSAVLEGGDEVCAAVEAADDRLEALELAPIADARRVAINRPDTRARAIGNIDIDNDGLEEILVELVYSSGAANCETNYFELLAEDGSSLASNSNALTVRALQKLDVNGPDERSCGSHSNRLIRFADKIYLDRNAGNAAGKPHELRILEGEASSTVCTFERQVRSRVKTLY